MSSILSVPVEILMDVFQANDPADMEVLQLTCRRFHTVILQNVNALPTRLNCLLDFDGENGVCSYRTPANNESNHAWRISGHIAWSRRVPQKLQEMYERFGRKTAIRKVKVHVDGRLTRLNETFAFVKGTLKGME